MKENVFYKLKHFKVIPFAILAAVFYFASALIGLFLYRSNSDSMVHFNLSFYRNAAQLFFLFLWCYMYFQTIRNIRYRDLTGRKSYTKDHARYKRTYYELIEYYQDANPYQLDVKTLPLESWKYAEGVILGKVGMRLIKRDSAGEGNLALFGGPGTHKTTSQIIPTALRFAGSVLAIDIKGDILHWTRGKRKIKIFNPEDPLSYHFDPLYGIEKMSMTERTSLIESFAAVILGEDPKDKYFVPGGRDFFCGIALYMLHEDIHTTFPKIINALLHGNAIQWVKQIVASDCDEAKDYLASYYGTNEVNVSGCYNTACVAVRTFNAGALNTLLDRSENTLSPQDLENGYDIYIELPQDKIKKYSKISSIMIQTFMSSFLRRPDSSSGEKIRPIIFLLDEFPQLHFDWDILSAALSTLRSKSVSLFLAQQSIAQLESKYGYDHYREIIDNCKYISIMSAQDPKSRTFFQQLIGTEKVLKVSNSQNSKDTSRSVSEAREYIYQPEDFGNLGEDVVIYANGKYIQAQKTNCFE